VADRGDLPVIEMAFLNRRESPTIETALRWFREALLSARLSSAARDSLQRGLPDGRYEPLDLRPFF
jgi:hypothetical protein